MGARRPDRPCDDDCNHCPVINHGNGATAYVIAQAFVEEWGAMAVRMVNNICPNLTVCPACRIDNFCHVEGCRYGPYSSQTVAPRHRR